MPTIRTADLEIAYEEVGSGPPLVLLHGASTTGRATFAAQIPALAESFRLYLPDARGHGRTIWDAADGFEAGWLVDDLEAFVDGLGLPHVPPDRLLDGGDDRARLRGPGAGAAADARRGRDHGRARAAGCGRAAADGPRADPPR